jgi:hypothetical protein
MNLGSLLARAYDTLGDDPATPRQYPRQLLVDAANRGCLAFRVACHDVWVRIDIPTVANQAEYTIPADILELRRVAYDDESLEARAANTLQSRDAKWKETTGNPISWTSLGVAHNKFRLWPIPSVGSDEVFTFTSDYGVIVRYQQPVGTDVTLSQEFGLMTRLDNITFTEDYGELFYVATPENASLTLWGTHRPETLVDDGQEIPIRRPWQIAILWFILWQAYESESDQYNSILSAWYRDQFLDQVTRCKERTSNPVPAQVRALRGSAGSVSTPNNELQLGDVVIGGVPVTTIWPSGAW